MLEATTSNPLLERYRCEDRFGCAHTPADLPYDPWQTIHNLRLERYIGNGKSDSLLKSAYYLLRPALPVSLKRSLQRRYLRDWRSLQFPRWPVDFSVETILEKSLSATLQIHQLSSLPFIWFWPDGHTGCATMTHDVETQSGRDFCSQLMDIDDAYGIKSSFQVVPEKRYSIPPAFLDEIRSRGFEINIHGLDHNGNLFAELRQFQRSAERINEYAKQFGAEGFRSPVLYRKADWLEYLSFSYDMSFPNVGHLDPQRGGCCTVFPYFIGSMIELPLTTTQDYSLFYYLNETSIRLWKEQIESILEKNGLVSLLVHPDYILRQRERSLYQELLSLITDYRERWDLWTPTPGELAGWWRARSEMTLRWDGIRWIVDGPQRHRAQVAYAQINDGQIEYSLQSVPARAVQTA